jgi:hypothetical protein
MPGGSTVSTPEESVSNGIGTVFEENMYAFIGAGAALLLICVIILIVCLVRKRRRDSVTTIHAVHFDNSSAAPISAPTPYLRQQEESYGSVHAPEYDAVGGPVPSVYGANESTIETLALPHPDQYQALPSHASETSYSNLQSQSPRPLLRRDDSTVDF